MAIVWSCDLDVQRYAAAGKKVEVPRPNCPSCSAAMIFWSGYLRPVRCRIDSEVWIRRACCRGCGRTDALLPSFLVHRRLDVVEVIGEVIAALALGAGARLVGVAHGLHRSTVRSWWSRHRERAELAVALAVALLAGAVVVAPGRAALVALHSLAPEALGSSPPPRAWRAASLSSAGLWLIPCHQHRLVPSPRQGDGV